MVIHPVCGWLGKTPFLHVLLLVLCYSRTASAARAFPRFGRLHHTLLPFWLCDLAWLLHGHPFILRSVLWPCGI
ncbi:hypothetical protein EDB89DRAFT_1998168 [Lactarius sanguifluus]|nr:hypothetical protein EDB89DRAFT_1998168 [Lactarius sanguifluus]